MAETIVELARRDREAAVRRLMKVLNIERPQAERILAVELGEFEGDVFVTGADGIDRPLQPPPGSPTLRG